MLPLVLGTSIRCCPAEKCSTWSIHTNETVCMFRPGLVCPGLSSFRSVIVVFFLLLLLFYHFSSRYTDSYLSIIYLIVHIHIHFLCIQISHNYSLISFHTFILCHIYIFIHTSSVIILCNNNNTPFPQFPPCVHHRIYKNKTKKNNKNSYNKIIIKSNKIQ